jgi:hypothetical protein
MYIAICNSCQELNLACLHAVGGVERPRPEQRVGLRTTGHRMRHPECYRPVKQTRKTTLGYAPSTQALH